jgi:site-specific DNA recombinase
VRVSTEKQAEEGFSLKVQANKVAQYVALHDLHLVETIKEVGSAESLDREGLQRALELLEAGKANALLVVHLDRLTRSRNDLERLIREYFSDRYILMSIHDFINTGTANGRMFLNMLVTCCYQWSRETTSERTSEAMLVKKARGEYTGGLVPYGQSRGENNHLALNSSEKNVIEYAKELRKSGLSLNKISDELAKSKMFTRNGNKLSGMQVSRLLKK